VHTLILANEFDMYTIDLHMYGYFMISLCASIVLSQGYWFIIEGTNCAMDEQL